MQIRHAQNGTKMKFAFNYEVAGIPDGAILQIEKKTLTFIPAVFQKVSKCTL